MSVDRRPSAVSPPTVGEIAIYLCQDPVDFRLGINGLSVLVEGSRKFDPFTRNLFCFVNKRPRFPRKQKIAPENGSCFSTSCAMTLRPSKSRRMSVAPQAR
jgi:transposase